MVVQSALLYVYPLAYDPGIKCLPRTSRRSRHWNWAIPQTTVLHKVHFLQRDLAFRESGVGAPRGP